MEHHSERFGALRPDERWMMAPRRDVAERAGVLSNPEMSLKRGT